MDTTDWTSISKEIPLSNPPMIVHMAHALHGQIAIESYKMHGLWCLHLYQYEAEVVIGGVRFPIMPGYASVIPADTTMEYHFTGRSPHLYAHFRCQNQNERGVNIPTMVNLGNDFRRIYDGLDEVIGGNARRAECRLWDTLWQMSRHHVPDGISLSQVHHPAIRTAVEQIDSRPSEPLTVSELAQLSGVSEGHLGRLFQQSFGESVAGYIRARRIKRAEHLLRSSTVPVKVIAVMVGIPDLQHFNKTIHQAFGKSPSALRDEHRLADKN